MGLLHFQKPPVPIPGRKIYQSPIDADFKIDLDVCTCVHGYLSKDKKQRASLIVFAAQLVCAKEEGTFNRFQMDVDFHDADIMTKSCKPTVLSTAPFSVVERDNVQVRQGQQKDWKGVKTNGNAELGFALGDNKIGVSASKEVSRLAETSIQIQRQYFGKGSSNIRSDASNRRFGVWWNVKKSNDPDAKDDAGVRPNYRFAVLLLRESDAPFEARICLNVEAGRDYKMEKTLEILAAKGEKSLRRALRIFLTLTQEYCVTEPEPIVFDPESKVEGDSRGIDPNMLRKWVDQSELEKLTILKAAPRLGLLK